MSPDSVTRLDLLRNAVIDPAEFLRLALERFLQDLMAADVAARIGAKRYERTPERTTQRNGHRDRDGETRLGTVHLQIPKLRQGSYFPSFLEPRRRSEQALAAVIQEAYVLGVSTRKVDELVQALGMTGLSKSSVSALCQRLEERVEGFRNRTLTGPFPYVWLDAKYLKVREGDRVLSMALVIATGVNAHHRAAGHGRRPAGLHELSGGTLAANRLDQPLGTPEPGDGAPHGRRRHLSQPHCSTTLSRRGVHGATRRMARGAPALLQPRVDG